MPNQPKKDITPKQPVSTGRVTRSQSPAVTETTAAMEPDNDSPTVADLYKLMKASKSENSTNYNSLKTQLTGMDNKLLQIKSDISKNEKSIASLSVSTNSNTKQITTLDERVKTAEKFINDQAALNRDLVNELRACKKEMNTIKEKQDKAEKERRKRNMIIHGVPENKDRHPRTIIQELLMDLKTSVNIEDCEAVFRMGPVPRNPKSVRPIMVTLNKSSDKGKIYTKVINLKGLEKWRGTTIADDLSPDQLKDKRDLQAILVLAKFQNVEAKLSGLAIVIEGRRYTHRDLEQNQLPEGMSLREAKTLELDSGFAFQGEEAPLSNMYRAPITYQGRDYVTNEQAYQHTCALVHNHHLIAAKIKGESCPFKCKELAKGIKVSEEWEKKTRFDVLKEINQIKFNTHPELREYLRNTGKKNLYEATLCREFGVGLRLHQFAQIDENSPGANKFGLCLMEIRYDLFYANE